MDSLERFFDKRHAADEISRINVEREIARDRAMLDAGIDPLQGTTYAEYVTEKRRWPPLDSIQFYDSGPDLDVIPYPEATFFTDFFIKKTMHHVGFLTDMPNPNFGVSDLHLTAYVRYVYLPSGGAIELNDINLVVPKEYERARIYHTGVDVGGEWPEGEYLVEVLTDEGYYFRGKFDVF